MLEKSKAERKELSGDEAVTVSKQDILAVLSTKAKDLAHFGPTATKYPTLRKILSSAAQELPPDTRLPGIRDLALCMGSSLVTIQKAVTELIHEGVLYSKPRAGVFVRDQDDISDHPADSFPGSSPQGPGHPFHFGFSFGTDSAKPHQQKFWMELAEQFCQKHPNAYPTLHFGANPPQHTPPLDVYECYNWKITEKNYPAEVNDILDIGGITRAALPVPTTREGQLPLYHRTYFLFYNPELLARLGLPVPTYKTFAAQSAYLDQVAPELARQGFDPKPFSVQEPVTLLGGHISDFLTLFDKDEKNPVPGPELLKATEDLLSFARRCQRASHHHDKLRIMRKEFRKGLLPFFMGYSVDYWEFSQLKLPFSLEAYPTLCCDDTFFLWPRVGTISRHSEQPVESLNLLMFLLRKESQQRFIATGNFGANLVDTEQPKMAADPAWVAEVLKRSSPFELAKNRYYMAINVFGGQVWRSLLEGISAAEVLSHAIQMGHFYLEHQRLNPKNNAPAEQLQA